MEKFLVIGSNCFSGAYFSDYVLSSDAGATVIGISRSAEPHAAFLPQKRHGTRYTFRQLDLNSDLPSILDLIYAERPSYIVNFAAQGMVGQSWQAPEQWFRTNCMSLVNLAHGLASRGTDFLKRYVQISSPEVYGSSNGETEEQAHMRPSTPYAASKAAGDMALYPYFLHKGFPLVYTRATNVYGAHQQLYRIIPRTALFINMKRKIELHGGGAAVKSYIHMRDVADATLRAARDGHSGDVYHISPDGAGISIRDLVALVCDRMGVKFEDHAVTVGERLGQDAAYVINSDKIRRTLGWRPTVSMEQGIDEVVAWVDANYGELIKQPLDYIHKP